MTVTSEAAPRPRWYYRSWWVLLMLFVVLGPFGLPLLWKSPCFSRWSKIALTVAVAAYTILLLEAVRIAIRAAIHGALEQMDKEMNNLALPRCSISMAIREALQPAAASTAVRPTRLI